MRLDAAIADATDRLSKVSESARLDAEILLCQTIDMPRSYLFAHPEDELDDLTRDRFEALMRRRIDGEPMSYITGTREFWSRELLVSPATLVPRPETELLVELALREIPRKSEWQILDLGTGSGAIAISIAGERPLCSITATDNSAEALAVARENMRQADLANVVCLVIVIAMRQLLVRRHLVFVASQPTQRYAFVEQPSCHLFANGCPEIFGLEKTHLNKNAPVAFAGVADQFF